MHEILDHLPAEALVLDLGCGGGSFDASAFPFLTVHVDLKAPGAAGVAMFAQADASKLPFRARTFDAVICNHGLEHFKDLKPTLQEIGRVLKRGGALFVSVPDAWTFQDRLYRWLAKGGGHVNLFANPGELARMLAWYSGLPHVATKTLHTSFCFLNRRNLRPRAPARFSLFCWRWELPLLLLSGIVRFADRVFGTRMSVYGWAMYFGNVPEPVSVQPWTNVCLRCGQAHPSEWLEQIGAVRGRWFLFPLYACPGCGASNVYSRDE